MTLNTIAVVGAGTMGNGIAQVFAAHGFNVLMQDVSQAALNKGLATISNSLSRLIKKEVISEADKQASLERITSTTDLQDLNTADLVIEAASENVQIKAEIFRSLDQYCQSEAILASNTSSISLTRIAREIQRSDKVIGMHFMNPVPLMKLVEIIRALQTSEATFQSVYALSKRINKVPVLANDSPGFVSNRILMPMINEAVFTLYEGVATAEAIDEIMKLGMAHPMGPLALADLIGLDTCLSIMEVLHEGLGDSKYRPCPLLRRMVDAGYLGRKTGRGFYTYES